MGVAIRLLRLSPLCAGRFNIVDVSLPKRLELLLVAALAAGVLVVACGGGDKPNTPTSGGATETTTERRDTGTPLPGTDIQLDTSLETAYYDVEGTTTEAIFANIEDNGPTDGNGQRGSGLTSVVWGYEWQGGPEQGDCSIRTMTIKAEMVVTLPKHVDEDSLSPEIRDNWDAYAESVAVHEQTHVDIYKSGAETIRQRMLSIGPMDNCDDLEAEIKRVWAEEQARINNQQSEFHQQEADRLAQQRAPIAAQIDANRSQINTLSTQITALDTEISDLRSEIDSLILQINDIDQEISAINDSDESQQDKQAKLAVLIQQRNALQSRHNEAVDQHNQALQERDPLVNKRNQLIDETNELVDEFNWTR
jgi:predicted secreted Zn-dependent protease